jgi:hypothetical protein
VVIMSDDTPYHVTRRMNTAAFVLGQLRAPHTPWGDQPDPDSHPVRLPLPAGFPAVDVPRAVDWHVALAPHCGLPGTEVRVLLANGYGLNLLMGRGYSGHSTVEAQIFRHHGSPDDWEPAEDTPVATDAGPGLQGWADGPWLAAALVTLAALPPHRD